MNKIFVLNNACGVEATTRGPAWAGMGKLMPKWLSVAHSQKLLSSLDVKTDLTPPQP